MLISTMIIQTTSRRGGTELQSYLWVIQLMGKRYNVKKNTLLVLEVEVEVGTLGVQQ